MNDLELIELYFLRDEKAIQETKVKYGTFCHKLAFNILSVHEDAEECVNDTYLTAWYSIPPEEPRYFKGWLGRVVRNISLDLWRKNHRQKRYAGINQLFEELAECIPSPANVESEIENKELTDLLNKWLAGLPQPDCALFIRRYWYGDSLKSIARSTLSTPADIANHMYRLRQNLKKTLEKQGVLL